MAGYRAKTRAQKKQKIESHVSNTQKKKKNPSEVKNLQKKIPSAIRSKAKFQKSKSEQRTINNEKISLKDRIKKSSYKNNFQRNDLLFNWNLLNRWKKKTQVISYSRTKRPKLISATKNENQVDFKSQTPPISLFSRKQKARLIAKNQGYQRKKTRSRLEKNIKGALEPAAKYRPNHIQIQSEVTKMHSTFFGVRWRYVFASGVAVSLTIILLVGSWGIYDLVFRDLPDVQELTQRPLALSSKIYDRNGELLYTMYEDENRTVVPLSKISPYAIQATLSIEDKAFYEHFGFSLSGIARAVLENYQGKPIQGGSTITQQLVKNRLLSPERSYRRKVRELLLSLLVERSFTKDQILEMYLNTVAYGGSIYGIEEASIRYFGKHAIDLDLAESALLAGLPAAPSAYSPFGPNPEYARARQLEVLRRMQEDGHISEEQLISASNTQPQLISSETGIKAPHFVFYVRQLLAQKFGEEALYREGLRVVTTLDLNLQEQTQEKVTSEIETLQRMRISNGAALVTNPQTGEVLAMVGSRNYFDIKNDGQVNVTTRPRQPGSSIKPLVYSLGLQKGMTVRTTIDDSPVSYAFAGSPPYTPKNYDGKFHGRVTLKTALANSYNIPAVKTLAQVGINDFIDHAQKMGISTWKDRSRFGLSLSLGSGEVLMTDLATAYGVFANNGYRVDLNPIVEITSAKGEVLYKNECIFTPEKCPKQKVFDSEIAYLMTSILSDNVARTPAFGALSTLHIPNQEVAVKTGTTNSMRDNWTVGYTSNRVVAVWVGNNDNTPMSYVASGITGASPIWNEIMRTQLSADSPHVFAIPPGLVKVASCNGSGSDFFVAGTESKVSCPKPANIAKPPPSPGTINQTANNSPQTAL